MKITTVAGTTFAPFRDICRRLSLRGQSVERLSKTALIAATSGGALPRPATHISNASANVQCAASTTQSSCLRITLNAGLSAGAEPRTGTALADGLRAGLELVEDLRGALVSGGYNLPWHSIEPRLDICGLLAKRTFGEVVRSESANKRHRRRMAAQSAGIVN